MNIKAPNNLKTIGEFALIDRIKKPGIIRPEDVIKGIDDDCAVFKLCAKDTYGLVTTDALVQDVHFRRSFISPGDLGYKALAVNLSDIAAMGGTPKDAYITLAIPNDYDMDFIDSLYRGLYELAHQHQINILGGDTAGSKHDLFISVTVFGTVHRDHVCYRHLAQPGDQIFVTGTLGDSSAGLDILFSRSRKSKKRYANLVQAHNRPRPCLREGQFLSSIKKITSMIDLSDGLGSDIFHICTQSGVGALIKLKDLPLSESLRNYCNETEKDPNKFAISGGEDYQLLFTVPARTAKSLIERYDKEIHKALYLIGEVTDSQKVMVMDEQKSVRVMRPSGWDHFYR